LAVPAGRLADQIGRPVVFLAGHGLLLILYGLLLWLRPGLLETAISLLCSAPIMPVRMEY
jgi:hypothetical protein